MSRLVRGTMGFLPNNRYRVFGPTLLALAVLWGLALSWSVYERSEVVASQRQVLSQLNSAVAEHFNGILKLTEFSLNTATQWLADRRDQPEIPLTDLLPLADNLLRQSDGLVDLILIEGDGRIILLPPQSDGTTATAHGRDYYEAQRAGFITELFIGAPLVGRVRGQRVIPVTIPAPANQPGRFFLATINISRLVDLHERQRMKPGGAVTIARTDGMILVRAPMEPALLGTSLAPAENFQNVWLKRDSHIYSVEDPITDRIPRLVSFIRLKDYPVFVSISARMEDVLAPWLRRNITMVGGMTVLSLLIFMGATYLVVALNRWERSFRRFADIAETVSDLIWEVGTDWRFTFVSNRYLQVLGRSEDQITGRTLKDLGWAPFDEATRRQMLAAAEQRRPFTGLKFTHPGGSPPHHVVEVTGRPFFDSSGQFAGYRGVMSDITRQLAQEQERQHLAQRQAQAGKLEALGQLAGGIAHDFNNLLGAILGFAQFLVQDSAPGSQQRRYAERVVMAGQRGRGLVQQILTFSRRSPGSPVDLPLDGVVLETCELLRATLPATTDLQITADGAGLMVRADRDQLGQVLLNLCINASDALEGRPGRLAIRVAPLDSRRPELRRLPLLTAKPTPMGVVLWSDPTGFDWIATGGLTATDNISITVSDTGTGIAREYHEPLFDLFFTTKAREGGSGIGLPVTQRVICEHGGAILVRTRPGIGTDFEVILPRAYPAFDPLPPAGAPGQPPAPTRSAGVLVIDDDPGFCEMLEESLTRLGHAVVSVRDPVSGLAAVLDDPGLWDLVITDQTMPGLKGSDLVPRIRAVSDRIRIIICTGYSASLDEAGALALGADGFCTKPLDPEGFTELVTRLLKQSEAPQDIEKRD